MTVLRVAVLAFLVTASPRAKAADITVFAAASTAGPISAIIELFNSTGMDNAAAAFASSSTLARQIAHGAPADIYISANQMWMDYLDGETAIKSSTRLDILSNRLVLIAPADSNLSIQVAPSFPLSEKLAGGKLAMGDPDHVPAGIYGREALSNLGVWQSISEQVVRTQDVRAALALVESGEAAAGIVYATDAMISRWVRVVSDFPTKSHPPITYSMAIVHGHDRPEVKRFYEFLKSKKAAFAFTEYGFAVIHWLMH